MKPPEYRLGDESGSAFGDLQTVEALASHLGYTLERTRDLLAAARVTVIDGVFSLAALRAALGGPAASGVDKAALAPVPQRKLDDGETTEAIVFAALAKHGLTARKLVRRRALEVEIVPRRAEQEVVYYSAIPLDHRQALYDRAEESEEQAPIRDVDSYYADEDLPISLEHPCKARVFTTRGPTSGAYHFTIARDTVERARGTDALDIVMVLALDTGRAWMMKVDDLRDVVDGTQQMSHVHIHKATGALRVALPLRRSAYDLDNRLMVRTRPNADD